MRKLSAGKIRGLQQIANEKGILTMCALDHTPSLKKMLGEKHTRRVSYQDMADFKLDLCQVAAPHASAALLDPVYSVVLGVKIFARRYT